MDPSQRRRQAAGLVAAALAVSAAAAALFAATAGPSLPDEPEDVPAPPYAREDIPEGAYRTLLDVSVSRIGGYLRDRYGHSDNTVYALPADADWAAIRDFYGDRFRTAGLKANGERDGGGFPYRLALWEHDGPFRDHAAAVALVDATEDDPDRTPRKFLVIVLAEGRDIVR